MMRVEKGYEPLAQAQVGRHPTAEKEITRGVFSGRKYGRLEPIRRIKQSSSGGNIMVECSCSCGTVFATTATNIRRGKTLSCGCFHREVLKKKVTKHGKSRTREHSVWKSMRQRCENPNSQDYKNYGGRGVSVCEQWKSFSNFLRDVGNIPLGYSIDRIDNDGNYCKENCKLSTPAEQSSNKRTTVKAMWRGEEKTLSQLSEINGVKASLIRDRLARGWSVEAAANIKPKIGGHYGHTRRTRI